MRNAYYAGRGIRFWKIMYEIGRTGERRLEPEEWRQLDCYDVGLTDLAKTHFGMDHPFPPLHLLTNDCYLYKRRTTRDICFQWRCIRQTLLWTIR